jgi:hypothetical protein
MRFTRALEEQIVEAITTNPEDHIVLPSEMYRPDGLILIHRDNLSYAIHRYLYGKLVRPLKRGEYLLPRCKVRGCINPLEPHRKLSNSPHPGQAANRTCPNGHEYTRENTLPASERNRCRQCKQERLARRRVKDAERRAALKQQLDRRHASWQD